MKAVLAISLAVATTFASAAHADELIARANQVFKPIPSIVPAVKGNVVTRERVKLGKMLFFEPRLSASHLISCNTCHNVGLGGGDLQETSIGHGWQKGPRNAPTMLNAVFNVAQFWDGRAEDLKAQAKGPVQAGVEMSNTPVMVEATLKSMPEYIERFHKAFPLEQNPVTFDNMAKAIEAFEATLITPGSRFDQYLEGNPNAMNNQEKRGLALFMDKGCSGCHGGVNLGGEGYFPFGVVEKPGADVLPAGDKGRFEVTKTADAAYVFRAAPLRNIELTYPYFHSGKVWSLKQAVAIMGSSQLGAQLSAEETDDITAFLKSLTGEQPRIEYPILPPSTYTTPKPKPMIP